MTYRIRKLSWQFGAAITLPWPTTVYVKKLPLDGVLKKHEEEHVRQLEKMGGAKYLATHVWARFRSSETPPRTRWNFWGKGHWIEDDAYRAESL